MSPGPEAAASPELAFWFGILSAASLPAGAAIGIRIRLNPLVVSGIMAFGAGSLLAALTIELMVPAFQHAGFWPLFGGSIVGGVFFVLLNRAVNGQGGYLRKQATLVRHMARSERSRMRSRIRHLAGVDVMHKVPPEEIADLMHFLVRRKYKAGETLYRQGDHADSFFLVDSGEVLSKLEGQPDRILKEGDSIGTRSFMAQDKERMSTATALTAVEAWELLAEDFHHLAERYPVVEESLREVNARHARENRLQAMAYQKKQELEEVLDQVDDMPITVSEQDIMAERRKAAMGGGSAALAIWLGIFLDGIPESAVIGASMHASISLALIAGLFLANLPESLSAAAGMRAQNMSVVRIMVMWTSLMVMTGVGAYMGNVWLQGASPALFAAVEGLAAGAMLVMVAQTMLPEAYHHGGSISGLCTLLGFMTALFIKHMTA